MAPTYEADLKLILHRTCVFFLPFPFWLLLSPLHSSPPVLRPCLRISLIICAQLVQKLRSSFHHETRNELLRQTDDTSRHYFLRISINVSMAGMHLFPSQP